MSDNFEKLVRDAHSPRKTSDEIAEEVWLAILTNHGLPGNDVVMREYFETQVVQTMKELGLQWKS